MTQPKDSILFSTDAGQVVRQLLQKYDLAAKKSWGQNFLVDDLSYQAIVEGSELTAQDVVVEIGAGLGTLTARLLATGAIVMAIERENDMCQILQQELGTYPRFILREENALLTDFSALAKGYDRPIVVVGNLPYQIATPLLFHVLEARASIRTIIFMFQREVADRIVAAPNTEYYGALSAQVQMLAQARRIRKIGPGGFIPQPKIDSALVRLTPFSNTRIPVKELGAYQRIVQAAFSMRRKTLRNTLGQVLADRTDSILQQAKIDPQRRGETLSVEEFARLADLYTDDFGKLSR